MLTKNEWYGLGWLGPLGLLFACNSGGTGSTGGGASGVGGIADGGAAGVTETTGGTASFTTASSAGSSSRSTEVTGGTTAAAGAPPVGGSSDNLGGATSYATAIGGATIAGGATSTGNGGSGASDAGSDASTNIPPVPDLWYEIDLNVWVQVKPGDTVIRPVNKDINWGACNSSDPDGHVVEIWLYDGALTQLMGPGLDCIQEYTEQTRTPVSTLAYLQVIDDKGAQSELTFYYQTQ